MPSVYEINTFICTFIDSVGKDLAKFVWPKIMALKEEKPAGRFRCVCGRLLGPQAHTCKCYYWGLFVTLTFMWHS